MKYTRSGFPDEENHQDRRADRLGLVGHAMKWLGGLGALLLAVAAGVAFYHVIFTIYHGQVSDPGELSNLVGPLESSFLYWFAGTGLIATIGLTIGLTLLLPATLRIPDWSIALIPASIAAQMLVRFYLLHVAWLVPSLLAGLSLWLASEIARFLYGDRAASLTRVLLCFAPFLLSPAGVTPATAAMLAAIFCGLRYPRDMRKLWLAACAIAGLAAIVLAAPTLGFVGVLAAAVKLLRLNYWLLGCPLSLLLVFAAPIAPRPTKLLLAAAAILLAFGGPSEYLLGILAAAGLERITRAYAPVIAIAVVNLTMFLPPQLPR